MNPIPLLDTAQLAEDWAIRQQKVQRLAAQLGKIRDDELTIGTTPKEAVFQLNRLTLYPNRLLFKTPISPPLLIVYALINRPYMLDLQPDRSLVRQLLGLGVDLYLIDWGYPGPTERWLTLDDYINDYLDSCVEQICHRRQVDQVNVLGICQGGTFSLCYTALHPEKVRSLITMITPVDFHVPATPRGGLLNVWCQTLEPDRMVETLGNIPGAFMNDAYLMLRPFALTLGKYADLLDATDDEARLRNFLRMEKWIADSPDQAGEAWRQFVSDFYQGNKLVQGTATLGGRLVDLGQITMPVLNLYAEEDHLVPPASSLALGRYIGTDDYTVRSFPVGHIGMYVSGKVQHDLAPLIANWLKARGDA